MCERATEFKERALSALKRSSSPGKIKRLGDERLQQIIKEELDDNTQLRDKSPVRSLRDSRIS